MAKAKVKPKASVKSKAKVTVKKPARKAVSKPVKKAAPKAVKKPILKVVKKPVPKAVKKPALKQKIIKKAAAVKPVKQLAAKVVSKPVIKTLTNNVNKTVTPIKSSARKITKPKKVKLPEGYRPNEKEEYMSDAQVEYFRQKLVSWKTELSAELQETMDNLKEENWQEPDITDRATVEIDTGLELRTRDRYRKLINKIDAALYRLERGEYGYCEETGEEIGIKRLEARPIATLSVEAQERHERDERTHYDEDLEDRL